MPETPGSPAEPGLLIKGEFYPQVEKWTLTDFRVAFRVSGLSQEEFMQGMDEGNDSILFMLGVVAVHVRHKYPDWSQARLERFIDTIAPDDVEAANPDGVDEDPPAATAGDTGTSSGVSESTAVSSGTNQASTGLQSSEITAA